MCREKEEKPIRYLVIRMREIPHLTVAANDYYYSASAAFSLSQQLNFVYFCFNTFHDDGKSKNLCCFKIK